MKPTSFSTKAITKKHGGFHVKISQGKQICIMYGVEVLIEFILKRLQKRDYSNLFRKQI